MSGASTIDASIAGASVRRLVIRCTRLRAAWARRRLTTAIVGLMVAGVGVSCGHSDKIVGPTGTLQQIVISPSADSLTVGASQTLIATGHDASGRTVSGLTFFWSSSNDTIATVTQGGQVASVGTGQVRIAASVQGISGFSTVTVSPKPVGSIVIVPGSATLRIATTLQLGDTVKDGSGSPLVGQIVTWSSDNATIVSVDGNGLLTARALGTAHITASSGGKSAQATIAVSRVPVVSITIAPLAPSVFVGQTTQLTPTTKDSIGDVLPGRVVRWSSQTTAVATIDSISGILTGVSPGTSQVTALSEGVSAHVTATVSTPPVNSVVLSPNVSQVDVGQTVALSAVVTDAGGNPVSNPTVNFTSNKPAVASVASQSGATAQILAGPTAGTATITGTSGTATGTATIIVSPVGVDSVNISAPHDTLTPGQMETLTATPFDSSGNPLTGRTITWQSSNTAIATVTGSGVVTAQASGLVVIFATTSGVRGSLTIDVTPAPVASVTISPAVDTILVLGQTQLHATVKDVGGATDPRTGTWYSTNNSTAVVTSMGLVTGVAAGTASIIDSVGGKADTNTTVVVLPPAPVSSVVVYPTPDTVFATSPGGTVQLHDSTKDASGNNLLGRAVTWSPTSGGVAATNASGFVTANGSAAGSATITATSSDGPSGSAQVLVIGHAQSLTVNFPVSLLSVSGQSGDMSDNATATILDTFGSDVSGSRLVTWSSSDPTTITINGGSGPVTALGSTTVNLAAVSTNSTSVIITATTTDHGTVTVTNTLTIVVFP